MNRAWLMIAALVASVGLAAGAGAQGMGPGMGRGPGGPGMMAGQMLINPDMLPELKAKLAITPAQEPAWAAYADSVKAMAATREKMHDGVREMPMAERMASRDDRRTVGAQMHREINDRREALSKALSADQRTILDREAPPLPMPPGR